MNWGFFIEKTLAVETHITHSAHIRLIPALNLRKSLIDTL